MFLRWSSWQSAGYRLRHRLTYIFSSDPAYRPLEGSVRPYDRTARLRKGANGGVNRCAVHSHLFITVQKLIECDRVINRPCYGSLFGLNPEHRMCTVAAAIHTVGLTKPCPVLLA